MEREQNKTLRQVKAFKLKRVSIRAAEEGKVVVLEMTSEKMSHYFAATPATVKQFAELLQRYLSKAQAAPPKPN